MRVSEFSNEKDEKFYNKRINKLRKMARDRRIKWCIDISLFISVYYIKILMPTYNCIILVALSS